MQEGPSRMYIRSQKASVMSHLRLRGFPFKFLARSNFSPWSRQLQGTNQTRGPGVQDWEALGVGCRCLVCSLRLSIVRSSSQGTGDLA